MAKEFKYKMLYNQDLDDELTTLNTYGTFGYKAIHFEKVTGHSGLYNILLMKEE